MLESATLDNSVPVQGIPPRVDRRSSTPEGKIARVVYRLLADHSIERTFGDEDDLRDVGLTSLDMASLVLSVEAEFDLLIPERDITPANFRTVATITTLVTSLKDPKLLAERR
jgi:acyl carrier protein